MLVCFLIWELIQDRFVGFGLSTFGNPLKFICRWDFLLVERTRSRQKWRQEECGRAPVCEGKLMRRLAWRGVFLGEMRLHVKPVHVRHLQIENDAIRQACLDGFQKLRTGAECLHTQADGTHQAHERFANGFFVVNDSNVRRSFGHKRSESKELGNSAQLDLGLLYFRLLYLRLLYLRLLYFRLA